MAWLEIVSGARVGQTLELSEVLVIGRHDSCDLILSEASVSRTHALISRRGDAYVVRDLAASNGVFLQGARLCGTLPLRDGNALRIGSVILIFHARSAPSRAGRVTTAVRPIPRTATRATPVIHAA